jgi:Rad3-related DNA helicase
LVCAEAALALRNIVPGHFLAPRTAVADSLVLFSATLNPTDYFTNLLGLPDTTQRVDVASPFAPEQLAVVIRSLSTRRDDRLATLNELVDTMAEQFTLQSGNYLAFFSSFEYLKLAQQRLQLRHPALRVWSQQRQMGEASRRAFLQEFDVAGQGIGFAVLGGVFGEGIDLPGKRLIGAFIATLGLPQFNAVNQAICQRMQERFGRGYDYTYVFPGLQKVVQAAGRVIRTQSDVGTVLLLDERYREFRYRQLLPAWWKIALD